MKKWIQKFGFAAVAASLFVLAPNAAQADCCSNSCCDPCDWDFCDWGEFELGAEFLWWKPCVDDLDYAAHSDWSGDDADQTFVNYKSICPDWEPGVRVWMRIPGFYCDWDLTASYTYVDSDDSSKIIKDGEVWPTVWPEHEDWSTFEDADIVKASWDMCYHEWDLLVSYDISCKECHHFMPFFGVAGMHLKQEFKTKFIDSTEDDLDAGEFVESDWDSDYWGVGLRAGTNYEYRLSDCLRVYTKAAGTILAGDADSDLTIFSPEAAFDIDKTKFKDDDCCQLVPGYHLGVGFIYDADLCDCSFSLKLGYEFINWHNLPKHRDWGGGVLDGPSPASPIRSSLRGREIGFHGLVAGLSFSF